MKKLLVLCPSRGRPQRILGMIRSFEITTDPTHTQLMILLDEDDPKLMDYLSNVHPEHDVRVYNRAGDKTYTTEIINRAFLETDYAYYSVTNDDIHYITPNWDRRLCNIGAISTGVEDNMVKKYGKDFVTPFHIEGFPITSVIDARIPRCLGWLQYPELKHSAGDNVWYRLACRMNILYIAKDIHYVHKSAYYNDGEADETFNRTNARTNHGDYLIFKDWLKYKCEADMNTIKDKIGALT